MGLTLNYGDENHIQRFACEQSFSRPVSCRISRYGILANFPAILILVQLVITLFDSKN